MPDLDAFICTLNGQKSNYIPTWAMRQAGRILPSYQKLRKKIGDFKTLVTNPQLAAEVTLQPIEYLDVDALIIFSDILVIPEAMGCPYTMQVGKGPAFNKPIRSKKDVDSLSIENISEKLTYVSKAIQMTKAASNKPLIGFAGAPWTVFAFMVEGQSNKTFAKARQFLYAEPQTSLRLLKKITNATIQYLNAQIQAGADAIQLFDTAAGLLSPEYYNIYSIPLLKDILNAIKPTPTIVFAKDAHFSLNNIAKLPTNACSVDWGMDIDYAKKILGKHNKALQGTWDPAFLYANPSEIKKITRRVLDKIHPFRHIANLGHGVYPDMKYKHLQTWINEVHNYKI